MYKHLYQNFLAANSQKFHFACHSHHFWPDCTRQAQLDYWDDSAKYVDQKWEYFFSEKIPLAQKYIAKTLNLAHPENICFAPNTHELLFRLISCLDLSKPLKILTTDSEFHSFSRQCQRLEELPNVQVTRLQTKPYHSFENRLAQHLESHNSYDLIFLSQVFFNSAFVLEEMEKWLPKINPQSIIVLDGYHGFMAIPTNLKPIEDRVFYLAGSYKYAQAGEGLCFMHIPKNFLHLRPLNTGWFAQLGELSQKKDQEKVSYPENGMRFGGATMDFSALYRLISVFQMLEEENLTPELIHAYVQAEQEKFKQAISGDILTQKNLLAHPRNQQGHFLCFQMDNLKSAEEVERKLQDQGIQIDRRGNILRFGFGLYTSGPYEFIFKSLKS